MEPIADNSPLLALAASVSDGAAIDWDNVSRDATDEDTAVIEQLRVLQRIAAAATTQAEWGALSILEPIGEGSFGSVYRAFDPGLHRDIALKIIRPREDRPFELDHAAREARRLARVRHPNIVTVFRAERREDAVGIEMELIKGETLHALVAAQGPFSSTEAASIGIDICRALAAVHAAGLLHGDIKAHNVMREEGGRIVLMDLGAARDLAALPGSNDFTGTPLYVAPEVFAGSPRSAASDIYSLGVLLYYLATGSYPVEGDTRTQISRHHQQPGPMRRLRDVRPDLPQAFVEVVEQALDADPASRPRSAGALEAALRHSLGRERIARLRMATASWMIAAGILLTTGLVGAGYWSASRRAPDAAAGGTNTPAPAVVDPAPAVVQHAPSSPATAVVPEYRVEAALYRQTESGPVRLSPGGRVSPGDQVFAQITTSIDTHVFVINEDDKGAAFQLYPLRSEGTGKPLPAGRLTRLPGMKDGRQMNWVVSASGGRDHFVFFVTPDPQYARELGRLFADLPEPSADMPVISRTISTETINQLRSFGGLAPAAPTSTRPGQRLADQYKTPLPGGAEVARGHWIRTATLRSPEPGQP